MIRNLKALGLALVAVFAMSAMAASGAQAEKVAHFEIGEGTVTLDAIADGNQEFVAGLKKVVCTTLDGHAEVTPTTKPTEVTATGVGYTTCHTTFLGISFPTTVVQQIGCHYTFTAGTWTNGSADAHGSVHICGSTITIYEDGTHTIDRCQIHVPAQTVTGLTYTNQTTESKMAVTVDVKEVSVVQTTITDTNKLGCNNEETVTAHYTGNLWVKGTDINQNYSDVTVMGTP